jgi:hypothetical protein
LNAAFLGLPAGHTKVQSLVLLNFKRRLRLQFTLDPPGVHVPRSTRACLAMDTCVSLQIHARKIYSSTASTGILAVPPRGTCVDGDR